MPSGTEHHRHLARRQEIERAHHVVAGSDLMVDVLDAGPIRRKQSNGVMHFVDAEQGRITDSVAHPGIAHPGPKDLVARRISCAQPDMAEPCDSSVAFAVIALAAVGGPPHELDVVARGILEGDEAPHADQRQR